MSSKDSGFRHDRHFRRRLKAAQEGLHLPTEIELLRGMPFLSDDMATDVREFGERLSRRLKHKPKFEVAPLVASLDDLAIDQSVEALKCVMEAMDDANDFATTSAHDARLRIRFYLASCGDVEAAAAIACETASIALTDVRDYRDFDLMPRALAWAVAAKNYDFMRRSGITGLPRGRVSRDLQVYASEFETAVRWPEQEPKQPDDETSSYEVADIRDTIAEEKTCQTSGPKGVVVVFTSIGNDSTSEGKRVVKEFENLLDVALSLPDVPDLAEVRLRLVVRSRHLLERI